MVTMSDENFISEFKRVYKEKGKHDLKSQIPYLSRLAQRYKRNGRKNPREQWSDLLKAHSLFNSCADRCEGEDKERWEKAAYEIQNIYWGKNVETSYDTVKRITNSIKQKLESLRDDMRMKLGPVNDIIDTWDSSFEGLQKSPEEPEIPFDMCEAMKSISVECNDAMVEISHTILKEAVVLCGDPPCDFSAVAFGSLAKGEATPYSDLEFLFLIDERTDSSLSYFEVLAMTTYFIIGNLQETKLKYMNIKELQEDKWFEDEAMSGFKIDGLSEKAGNIPTGNGLFGRKNKFILTPVELGEEYRELLHNPAPDQTQPGDMTDMLTYTLEFYNHNHNNLLEIFQNIKAETKSNTAREQATMKMLKKDIELYNFIPSDRSMPRDKCLDLKSEIYRYPSILIYDLKLLFNIETSTTWGTLSRLGSSGLISQTFRVCLLFLICSAQYIRYSAYLHHNSQKDKISVLTGSISKASAVWSKRVGTWRLPQNLLFVICFCMTPVKNHISSQLSDMSHLKEPLVFEKYKTAAMFYSAVCNWRNYINCVHFRFSGDMIMGLATLFDLAIAYARLEIHEASIRLFTKLLVRLSSENTEAFSDDFGGPEKLFFAVTTQLARQLLYIRKVEQAAGVLQSLESYPANPEELATITELRGRLLTCIGEKSNAEMMLTTGINVCERSQLSPDSTLIVKINYNFQLANLYRTSGKVDKAEKQFTVTLKLLENLYGEADNQHCEIGTIYLHLGEIALKKCEYDKAYDCLTKVLVTFTSERRKALTEYLLGEREIALEEYMCATARLLKIVICFHRESLSFDENDLHFQGRIYLALGKCYIYLEKHEPAIMNLKRSAELLARPIRDIKLVKQSAFITESHYFLAHAFSLGAVHRESLRYLLSTFGLLLQGYTDPPYTLPSFLKKAITLLRSTIRSIDELSYNDRVNIRQCYFKLFHLYSKHKMEKQAIKYLNEVDKY